ncbi:MAG TPA: cyclic nucleotide-binding domain-containing protein [Thermoleophilaceae bacterium]|nr:cyclic nucleotide-binding domain-containing protein [Thermoleophilaceae bacterium]
MGTVRDALRLPDIRRIELGYGWSVAGELAGTVSLVVYAFGAGGAALVAAYAASRTLAGMVVALVLAGVINRFRRDRLLRWITAARAVLLAAAAAMAALHEPPGAVIALAAASSSLAGTYRPLQAAVLPWLVRTPAELTASNAVTAVMENFGALIGPLAAGVLLVVAAPSAATALAAGVLGVATASLARLTVPETPRLAGGAGHAIRDVTGGVAEFTRLAPPGGVAILIFAQTFVRGALVVLIPVLAVQVLALGESAVGWLNAAFGAGGLIGGAVAAAAVRFTRLGRSFVTGLLLWGLPLLLLALVTTAVTAYLALVVAGIGNAVQDTGCYTLVTRLAGPRAAGRVLGAFEFVVLAGLATGSILTPLLLHVFGVRGALALLGGGLAGLALAHTVRFMRLDRAMPAPRPEVGLLRDLPMFAPLPMAVTELLAAEAEPRQFPAGTVVTREGEPGDHFYVIVDGSAAVTVHGVPGAPLARGDCFGEIALLRDVPRTATVTAEQQLHTLALGRAEFLTALAGSRASRAAADALATQRLAADP